MKRTCFCLICLLLPLCLMQAQISWPNGKKAAIVLTYDDGLESQRRIAIPQLEAKNLRGTFFLYGQVVKETDVPQWRAVAQRGHELGNHSLFHPCLAGTTAESTSSPCHSLECYSVKDMLIEISLMNSFLYAIDGKQEHAYAYPCGQSVAGGEDYSQPLLRSGLTKYARGGGAHGMTTDTKTLDLSKVPTFAVPEGCKAQQLIGFVKEVADKGGLGVLVFHGVGGDYLTIDAKEHQQLVDYLDAQASDIWVGTFSEVLDYVSSPDFEADWKCKADSTRDASRPDYQINRFTFASSARSR